MAVERKLVTAEELLAMPDDGLRRELIDGEVRTMAPPGDEHGFDVGTIHYYVAHHLHGNPIGWVRAAETGFRLRRNPDRVRAPDLAIVLYSTRPREQVRRGYFEGAPDLAVEVISPSDSLDEVAEKVEDWLRAGSRIVWVLRAGPRMDVHLPDGTSRRLGPDDEVDGGDVLPGFRMRLRDLLDPHAP